MDTCSKLRTSAVAVVTVELGDAEVAVAETKRMFWLDQDQSDHFHKTGANTSPRPVEGSLDVSTESIV